MYLQTISEQHRVSSKQLQCTHLQDKNVQGISFANSSMHTPEGNIDIVSR